MHTFAHAYEAALNYSQKLNEGEAGILRMLTALKFSNTKKILKNKEYDLILEHIKNSRLPFNIKKYFSIRDINRILSFMVNDKKNKSKKINLILLKKIGLPIINNEYEPKTLKVFLKKHLTN